MAADPSLWRHTLNGQGKKTASAGLGVTLALLGVRGSH
jgi:hypothetical protein